jgi:23S rRNA pseudouridine2605 synthase
MMHQAVLKQEQNDALRLQRYLALAGVASRRACKDIVLAGRVTVNGVTTCTSGIKVQDTDIICLDGERLIIEKKLHYIAMNKPEGYICTQKDPQNRPLAVSLLPPGIKERIYSVGRLDFRSCGLILWTNDGYFTAKISHPSSGIEKEYIVEAVAAIPDALCDEFLKGITIDGELYRCSEIEKIGKKTLRIVLIEGKNREIRRVLSYFHMHSKTLRRIRIGKIRLGSLASGASRPLEPAEIDSLLF